MLRDAKAHIAELKGQVRRCSCGVHEHETVRPHRHPAPQVTDYETEAASGGRSTGRTLFSEVEDQRLALLRDAAVMRVREACATRESRGMLPRS